MRRLGAMILLAIGLSAGAAGGYWYARLPAGCAAADSVPTCSIEAAPAISTHRRVGFGSKSGMANLLGRELSAHQHG